MSTSSTSTTPADTAMSADAGAPVGQSLDRYLLERQRWMALYAKALAQLRDCQSVILAGAEASAEDRLIVLSYSGGSVAEVLGH